MATRALKPEDWSPVLQRKDSARAVKHEPRDERLRLSSQRLRPKPLNLVQRQTCPGGVTDWNVLEGTPSKRSNWIIREEASPDKTTRRCSNPACQALDVRKPDGALLCKNCPSQIANVPLYAESAFDNIAGGRKEVPETKAPPPSRKVSSESCCSPKEPEIVDRAPSGAWPQRDSPAQRKKVENRSSQCSATRPSEESFGILDYYRRELTPPLPSPELPTPTPKVDPAIEQFDFGLPPTPTTTFTPIQPVTPNVRAKAKAKPLVDTTDHPTNPSSTYTTPKPSTSSSSAGSKSYTLFPIIKETPLRHPAITPLPLRDIPTPHTSSTITSPDLTYRPRKESLSSSVRSIPIPFRLVSSSSTSTESTARTKVAVASRWSDDSSTIASPSFAITPGPRGSFGRDEGWPESFFEEDEEDCDESVPLGRRFRRGVGRSLSFEGKGRGSGSWVGRGSLGRRSYDGKEGMGRRVLRGVLCGCGGR